MNYSAFLQLHDELSLLAVIVIILIYDIFASEKGARTHNRGFAKAGLSEVI